MKIRLEDTLYSLDAQPRETIICTIRDYGHEVVTDDFGADAMVIALHNHAQAAARDALERFCMTMSSERELPLQVLVLYDENTLLTRQLEDLISDNGLTDSRWSSLGELAESLALFLECSRSFVD